MNSQIEILEAEKENLRSCLNEKSVTIRELEQQVKYWKGATSYLASCHAANGEIGLRKSCSKFERSRFISILEKCCDMLSGIESYYTYVYADDRFKAVQDRCSDSTRLLKDFQESLKKCNENSTTKNRKKKAKTV